MYGFLSGTWKLTCASRPRHGNLALHMGASGCPDLRTPGSLPGARNPLTLVTFPYHRVSTTRIIITEKKNNLTVSILSGLDFLVFSETLGQIDAYYFLSENISSPTPLRETTCLPNISSPNLFKILLNIQSWPSGLFSRRMVLEPFKLLPGVLDPQDFPPSVLDH